MWLVCAEFLIRLLTIHLNVVSLRRRKIDTASLSNVVSLRRARLLYRFLAYIKVSSCVQAGCIFELQKPEV